MREAIFFCARLLALKIKVHHLQRMRRDNLRYQPTIIVQRTPLLQIDQIDDPNDLGVPSAKTPPLSGTKS